jgi:hypothetical protein
MVCRCFFCRRDLTSISPSSPTSPSGGVADPEAPVVADHEPDGGDLGEVLAVRLDGSRLVLDAAEHVVADVGGFGVAGDPLGDELRGEATRVVVVGGLDGLGGDELADDGRGDDAAALVEPFVAALDQVGEFDEGHEATSCCGRDSTHPQARRGQRAVVQGVCAATHERRIGVEHLHLLVLQPGPRPPGGFQLVVAGPGLVGDPGAFDGDLAGGCEDHAAQRGPGVGGHRSPSSGVTFRITTGPSCSARRAHRSRVSCSRSSSRRDVVSNVGRAADGDEAVADLVVHRVTASVETLYSHDPSAIESTVSTIPTTTAMTMASACR